MNPLEARRRILGRNVYKRTTEGNPAIAQGSLARMYPGITMQGWTEQAQYEGKNLFNIYGDINTGYDGTQGGANTIEDNVLISGYNPQDGYIKGQVIDVIPDSVISVSFDVLGTGTGSVAYVEIFPYGETSVIKGYYGGVGNNISLSGISVSSDKIMVGFGTGGGTGAKYANIQVEYGNVSTSYEPYTGNQPSPSPDYPQEIVSAGNWNEETQKWEYEIEVGGNDGFSQTVLLTSDRPLTKWDKLTKKDGQWGWVYKSAENNGVSITKMHVDENIGEKTRHRFGTNFYPGYAYAKDILCSHLALVVTMDSYDFAFYVLGSGQLVIYAMDDTGISTLEEMQSYWNGLSDVTFWYETAEETFVPLSESEQEALNALHTFRPTTVLSNDCDCNMSLTYKTKKSLEVTT